MKSMKWDFFRFWQHGMETRADAFFNQVPYKKAD